MSTAHRPPGACRCWRQAGICSVDSSSAPRNTASYGPDGIGEVLVAAHFKIWLVVDFHGADVDQVLVSKHASQFTTRILGGFPRRGWPKVLDAGRQHDGIPSSASSACQNLAGRCSCPAWRCTSPINCVPANPCLLPGERLVSELRPIGQVLVGPGSRAAAANLIASHALCFVCSEGPFDRPLYVRLDLAGQFSPPSQLARSATKLIRPVAQAQAEAR